MGQPAHHVSDVIDLGGGRVSWQGEQRGSHRISYQRQHVTGAKSGAIVSEVGNGDGRIHLSKGLNQHRSASKNARLASN